MRVSLIGGARSVRLNRTGHSKAAVRKRAMGFDRRLYMGHAGLYHTNPEPRQKGQSQPVRLITDNSTQATGQLASRALLARWGYFGCPTG